MSPAPSTPSARRFFAGAFACVLSVLVFALGLLAVSPDIHARLHTHAHLDHDHDEAGAPADHVHSDGAHLPADDANCAIVLFAQGVSLPLELPRVTAPQPQVLVEFNPLSRDELRFSPPRYLHPPGRGPPALA